MLPGNEFMKKYHCIVNHVILQSQLNTKNPMLMKAQTIGLLPPQVTSPLVMGSPVSMYM